MNGNANTAFKELKNSAYSSQAAQTQLEINVNGILTTDSAILSSYQPASPNHDIIGKVHSRVSPRPARF